MNVREATGIDLPYETFNREERNLAAIFFHVLNLPGNLDRFLEVTGCGEVEPGFSPAVYFEYAYLRDLWARLRGNDLKHWLISSCLNVHGVPRLGDVGVEEFNQMFGATPKPSTTDVQSPGTWSLGGLDGSFPDNDDFLAVCMFKWCFKAKPDLVIQLGPERSVCIEAKLESGEGRYPSAKIEKGIFKRRGLASVGQTEVQRFMFARLLGQTAELVLLARKEPVRSMKHRFISWSEAFAAMDTKSIPEFMRTTIRQAAGVNDGGHSGVRHHITREFRANRGEFERRFQTAYGFLMRLENEGLRHEMWLSCAKNAHLYKSGAFLAYLRLKSPEQRPPSLLLSPRFNKRIVESTTDESHLLFPGEVDRLLTAESAFAQGWARRLPSGAMELAHNTPASFFDKLFSVLVELEVRAAKSG